MSWVGRSRGRGLDLRRSESVRDVQGRAPGVGLRLLGGASRGGDPPAGPTMPAARSDQARCGQRGRINRTRRTTVAPRRSAARRGWY